MIKLATWNINSLKMRLEQVLTWIEANQVDILALQETKTIDEQFPVEVFTSKGYSVVFSGQKSYNGTAIISRFPMSEVLMDIPSMIDPQRRILAVTIGELRLINLYVPNGSMVGSEKYQYKLGWLNKMNHFIKEQMALYPNLAVVGDFNIAPDDRDVHSPEEWEGCVHVSEPEREAFVGFINLGLIDSLRFFYPESKAYSWWDYRAGSFRRNRGLRIDHILLNEALMKTCTEVGIDIEPRRSERPSDHAPVWASLNLQ